MRFSHKVENIVNDKFIQCRCNMGNLSNNLALSGDVYIVSLEKIYGETCPYKEALIHLNEQYMPVIIIYEVRVCRLASKHERLYFKTCAIILRFSVWCRKATLLISPFVKLTSHRL